MVGADGQGVISSLMVFFALRWDDFCVLAGEGDTIHSDETDSRCIPKEVLRLPIDVIKV